MYNQKQIPEKQIAVLIDLENAGLSSIQLLFDQMSRDEISKDGRIIVKRAYADWSRASKSRNQLLELGIEPIQLFRSTSGRKNANDILLAIDAIELLHTSPIDIFVIVSSDSDFIPLINRLRASGKIVFCAGEQAKISSTLIKACDRHFYIDQDKNTEASKKSALKKEKENQSPTPQPDMLSIAQTDKLWEQIHSSWSKRAAVSGQSIPGPNAATEAARILGVAKLSSSTYKTLQGILNASTFLSEKWSRNANTIIRR